MRNTPVCDGEPCDFPDVGNENGSGSPGGDPAPIVDEEPSYRHYLERYLTRRGYEVRTASSGREALARGGDFDPDVVLADGMLKDSMHGLEVGVALRE